jgi:hypothetical protein
MTLARRPAPFRDLLALRRALDRLFDEIDFRPFAARHGSGVLVPLRLDVRTRVEA